MKATVIIDHLNSMKKAIKDGDKHQFLLLLDTLTVKTNPHQELIELDDFAMKINNNNGLSINIIRKGSYVKYIPDHDYITSKGVITKDKEFQHVIEEEFYDQIDLLFKDAEKLLEEENDLDGNFIPDVGSYKSSKNIKKT